MTDKKYSYKSCTAALGTMTAAQKAQKVLASAAIPSGMTKLDTSPHRGCVWGITFSCNQTENVRSVLAAAGIAVRSWGNENDIS